MPEFAGGSPAAAGAADDAGGSPAVVVAPGEDGPGSADDGTVTGTAGSVSLGVGALVVGLAVGVPAWIGVVGAGVVGAGVVGAGVVGSTVGVLVCVGAGVVGAGVVGSTVGVLLCVGAGVVGAGVVGSTVGVLLCVGAGVVGAGVVGAGVVGSTVGVLLCVGAGVVGAGVVGAGVVGSTVGVLLCVGAGVVGAGVVGAGVVGGAVVGGLLGVCVGVGVGVGVFRLATQVAYSAWPAASQFCPTIETMVPLLWTYVNGGKMSFRFRGCEPTIEDFAVFIACQGFVADDVLWQTSIIVVGSVAPGAAATAGLVATPTANRPAAPAANSPLTCFLVNREICGTRLASSGLPLARSPLVVAAATRSGHFHVHCPHRNVKRTICPSGFS
ncbi:hypothetical protein [Sinomonas albida]|uniref:hypothetical protein n=1 Tax=Sinomonas albida TaxID=369942 RepID=UPI001457D2FF|nr:hypothetical protein [Sinomonas albida]